MAAPSSSPSPEALARQLEALTAQLAAVTLERDRAAAQRDRAVVERDQFKQRVGWLEAQLERVRFGERTPREHVDTRQTQLAFESFFADLVGPTPGSDAEAGSDEPRKKKKPAVTPHGRRDLATDLSHLPVQVVELLPHPLPEGAIKAVTETSWRLGFQRARWIRLKIVRPGFLVTPEQAAACDGTIATFTDTDGQVLVQVTEPPSAPVVATLAPSQPRTFEEMTEQTLLLAPVPAEVVPRGLPSPELLAHLLHSKFTLHLPFHRLEQQCTRDGVPLTRGTMTGWLEAFHELGRHIVDAMEADARTNAQVILTDATGVLVQDNDRCKKGHFWVYVADRTHVLFRFSATHSSAEPKAFFNGFGGAIVSDAAAVFNALFEGEDGPEEANCWSHARRYFFKALDSEHRKEALVGIGFSNQLFTWERQWKTEPPIKRTALRQQWSGPLLAKMRTWIDEQRARLDVADGSRLRKALNYAHNQWDGLTHFVTDGRVPIHNNDSERQLRRIAVGRKNWLFVGDESTAPWTATAVTLLASCELHGLDGEAYLRDLCRVLPVWPKARMLELAPVQWRATRARLVEAELTMPLGPITVPAKE
ncbi:MAG: IS66 family transposase [Proteobacteria bacterium]|nr:MAG: IS66 family transposase [Pseudomonadota bacterium]